MLRGAWRGPSLSDERIGRFVVLCLAIGALALVAAAIGVALSLRDSRAAALRVTHTYQVIAAIGDYRVLTERAETARRGAILSSNPRYVRRAETAVSGLAPATRTIASLVSDNPRQGAALRELDAAGRALAALVRDTIGAVRRGEAASLTRQFDGGSIREVERARTLSARMQAEEHRLLAARERERDVSRNRFYALLAAAALIVLVVTALSLLATWQSLRGAWAARGALTALNADLEGRVAERTADLTRANEEIQRFAYIVSHDLRSPLVNVMGFTAELEAAIRPLDTLIARAEAEAPAIVTPEAKAAAREDLPEAVGFIRTSTQKMDRLINAILTLSRQGRRVLTPERIDVAALVEAIRGTLAHRIEAVGADVRVEAALPVLAHDRLAVEQILSNLIENAVKYRQSGRPLVVTVSGAETGDRASIAVADNGRGIDPRDHARIFDLFRRSGAQTEPGEGIGLAHARALAFRMGGTIDCRSEIGQGSTFTLQLPVKFAGEGDATT